ncbi:restriction endonuclease subunit S [Providencia rettgeri]|uniref:restriction endonuclease subunit S n=1 Tax=Providencia rettgeri TaxID=587 RepID=UPI0039F496AC
MSNGVSETSLNLIPAGYKQTEVGVIPEDWVIEKLGVIGKFKNGINKSADDFGYGYPFVNLMDVFGKPEIIGDEYFGLINSTELDKKEYSLVQGDVLFIRSSVKPSGVGLTTVVMSDLMDTVYSGFLIRFRTDNQLVIEFKKHCFYEESFRNRVICASTISANTNINQDSLKDIYLVYPSSKKEQTAIANALSDIDLLISELEKLITKKQAIKTATMQQLLTGRTRLPQFVLREDGSKKGTKKSELGEIPEDWEVGTIGDNCKTYSGGTPSTSNKNFYGGDIKWITSSDLNLGVIHDVAGRITDAGLNGSSAKLVATDTLLIALYGATAGVCAITRITAAINQAVLAIVPAKYNSEYLFYWFTRYKEVIIETYTQGGQPNLSGNIIRTIKLAFPPINEQTAIATILSDIDEEIQALEQRLSKTRQIKQGMMQELLTGKTRLVND